jgi:hypothetical protein
MEEETKDEGIIHHPKVIFDGVCDHFYEDEVLDQEGYMVAHCTKCIMGIRYNPDEAYILNGRLEKITKK